MSIVVSVPQGGSPVAPPAAALSRARNAADAAYQRFLAERGAGGTTGQVRGLPAVEIPRATVVQPAGGPIAMSWLLPPGATYPTATVVSGPTVNATAIPAMVAAPPMLTSSVVPPVQVATASSGVDTPQPSFATMVVRQSSVPMPMLSPPAAPLGVQRMTSGTPSVQRMVSGAPTVQRMLTASPSVQRMVSGAPSGPLPTVLASFQPMAGASGSPLVVAVPNDVEVPPAGPPPKLTDNIPDPSSVDRQKLQHARGLLERLQSETAILTQQNQVRKAMLAQYGAQQKAQHATQVDSDLQRQAMEVEQRGNQQLLQLQQAVMGQTMALEQQAAGLTLRYQCQLVEEDRLQKDYQIQRQFYQSEMQILGKMQQLVQETSANQAGSAFTEARSSALGSERKTFRDTNSFDAYLGNPEGRPQPRRDAARL